MVRTSVRKSQTTRIETSIRAEVLKERKLKQEELIQKRMLGYLGEIYGYWSAIYAKVGSVMKYYFKGDYKRVVEDLAGHFSSGSLGTLKVLYTNLQLALKTGDPGWKSIEEVNEIIKESEGLFPEIMRLRTSKQYRSAANIIVKHFRKKIKIIEEHVRILEGEVLKKIKVDDEEVKDLRRILNAQKTALEEDMEDNFKAEREGILILWRRIFMVIEMAKKAIGGFQERRAVAEIKKLVEGGDVDHLIDLLREVVEKGEVDEETVSLVGTEALVILSNLRNACQHIDIANNLGVLKMLNKFGKPQEKKVNNAIYAILEDFEHDIAIVKSKLKRLGLAA
jgi:hypothetical protein